MSLQGLYGGAFWRFSVLVSPILRALGRLLRSSFFIHLSTIKGGFCGRPMFVLFGGLLGVRDIVEFSRGFSYFDVWYLLDSLFLFGPSSLGFFVIIP